MILDMDGEVRESFILKHSWQENTMLEQDTFTRRMTAERSDRKMIAMHDPLDEPAKRKIEEYTQALAATQGMGDRREEGLQLVNLGLTHLIHLGQPESAIDYYEQALDIFHEIQDRGMEAKTLGYLGQAYTVLRQPRRAVKNKLQAITMYHTIDDRSGVIEQFNSLGLMYGTFGFRERAIKYYKQALALARAMGCEQTEAALLTNIGITYAEMRQEKAAFDHLEQARSLFHEIGNRKDEADTLRSIGTFHMLRGRMEFCIQTYEEALAISREIACYESEADLLKSLGMAYQNQKVYEKAAEYCQAALEVYGKMGSAKGRKLRVRLEACQRLANRKWWHFWS